MTSSCWRLMTFCHHPSLRWYWHPQYPSKFARCKRLFSSRWQKLPHSHSVDTANYAGVNPLPSPATCSSSSRELHFYVDSDTSPPTVPAGQHSSSQEPPSPLIPTTHTAVPSTQPPITTHVPSWADEVATAEQSGHSTPETVIPNWAYSGRIRRPRPRSQPLVYQPPVMPTSHTQRPLVSSTRYGPALTPLRPQPSFPQPPPYDRPTSTDNNPCMDPSPRRRPRATAHESYSVRSSPIQASQSPARHTVSPPRSPQPSSSRGRPNPFVQTHGIPHRSQGPNFRFHEFTNPPVINTFQGIHVPERINSTSTPPQHTLKPTASSFSLGQLENKYVQEGRDKDLPLECLHFPINPRFTERFWHLSKYFFALADRPNDYLNTFFTRDTAPYKIYAKYDPFYLQFRLFHPTQMDVRNTTLSGENATHNAQLPLCAASFSSHQFDNSHEFPPPIC